MDELKSMLDVAVCYFGPDDIVTIMLSQKLDRLIVGAQKKNLK